MKSGVLIWITGLAGSGKTSIAREVFYSLKKEGRSIVMLDGDEMRNVFQETKDYSRRGRLDLALRYARLAKLLTSQGIDVICSTISLFNEVHTWNSENFDKLIEVYVKVPMDVLKERDQKQLYSRAFRGEEKNVVGVDIDFEAPPQPDLIVENHGEMRPALAAERIVQYLKDLQS